MKKGLLEKKFTEIFHAPKFWAIVFVFLFTFSASAKTFQEYQKEVETAELTVTELIGYLYDIEEGVGEQNSIYESRQIAKIRTALPDSERIEWQGTVVETGNQWLKINLDAFADEPLNSPKREKILLEINERLASLSAKLKEIEASSASARSKDEEKQKLAEILSRQEYQKPEKEEKSLFEKWYEAVLEWLSNLFPRTKMPAVNPNSSSVSSLSMVLQIFLYVVVIGIVLFVIYKFAPFFMTKFRKREKREKKDRVILGERIAANTSSATIFDEAEKLAREGNLRGAIRKGYVALLCELSDRKIIGLAQYKTNRDYLRDVRKKRDIYENMNGLTNAFEKHWYGAESANEEDWREFRQKYQQTVSNKQ